MRLDRRHFLKGSVAAALGSARSISAQKLPDRRLRVLVIGGHPGDPEYGCAGTIARYVERKDEVTILYLNRGEKGCGGKSARDCGDLRTTEATSACRILGASAKFADQIDGEAIVSAASYDRFSTLLQQAQPDVIFTHWPIDNHRDHRAASNLAYDAWLRMKKSPGLYYYEVSDGEDTVMFSPTDYVDIGTVEAKKRSACFAHASQSPERFYALQSQVMQFRGVESGYRQAEAFVRHRESIGSLLP